MKSFDIGSLFKRNQSRTRFRRIRDFAIYLAITLLFSASLLTLFYSTFRLPSSTLDFPANVTIVSFILFSVAVAWLAATAGPKELIGKNESDKDPGPPMGKRIPVLSSRSLVVAALVLVAISTIPHTIFLSVTDLRSIPPELMHLVVSTHDVGAIFELGFSFFSGIFAEYLSLVVVLGASAFWLIGRVPILKLFCVAVTVAVVGFHPAVQQVIASQKSTEARRILDVAKYFSHPIVTARSARKRNLVILYLESMERTFGAISNTKNAFSEFNRLEQTGIYASNLSQISGTSFSAAGLIASQCGVPFIFQVGRRSVDFFPGLEDGYMFLPGLTCLGDLLKREDYVLSHMNNGDMSQFAIKAFLETHGYERFFDENSELHPAYSDRLRGPLGIEDTVLFQHALFELDALAKSGRPFLLSIANATMHAPTGFVSSDCPPGTDFLSRGIECTKDNVRMLLDHLNELGIADDTVVVILSDHLFMGNPYMASDGIGPNDDARRNLFMILNSDISSREIARPATPLDIYPTVLNAMGFTLAQDKANLGVSLLSDRHPTLVESFGTEIVDLALSGNTELGNLVRNSMDGRGI